MRAPIAFASEAFPEDRRLVSVQEPVRQAAGLLNAVPFMNGYSVTQTFTAGQTVAIQHKLGRKPVGWFVTDVINGDGTFRRATTAATSGFDQYTISIRSANACTATFWVF